MALYSDSWDLTFLALGKDGIVADNFGGFGHVVQSILGEEPPDNGKWFWGLYIYGAAGKWVRQKDAVDTVNIDEYPHIAWRVVPAQKRHPRAPHHQSEKEQIPV
eukprot:3159901-Amphidinium_carterae.1